MLTLTIGSFALAIHHLLLILALALATLVGWQVAKRGGENPESVLFGLFLLGLLVARIGFVLAFWQHFQNSPLKMLDLRDGGFMLWPGLLAVIAGAVFWGWRRVGLRRPLAAERLGRVRRMMPCRMGSHSRRGISTTRGSLRNCAR